MAMEKITLQFITEKSFGSWLIRWLTWSDYSHVDLVLPDGRLLGARFDGGVQIRNSNYGKFTRILRLSALVSNDSANKMYAFALAQVGKPYDWTSIVNFGFHRNWRETDSWFCSEAQLAISEAGDFPWLRAVDVRRITPRDLTLSPLLTDENYSWSSE